jgi:hypothetical protein
MGYDAFLSYSHEADAEVAPAVAAGLERLAKPWYRRRALRVFSDTSALSANPALWSTIAAAMDESERLVALASPESARSPWVGREIEHWVATKPRGTILLALTDGDLVWDDARGGFDPDRSTALHPALRDAFDEEPLYVDLRWTAGEGDLTLRNPQFLGAVAVLAAPLRGVPKDELVGEDLRQHRRTVRLARAAVAALVILAGATVVGALVAMDQAEEAQQQADEVVAANESLVRARNLTRRTEKRADAAEGRADDANRDRTSAQRDADRARANAAELSQIAQQEADAADAAAREAQEQQQLAAQATLGANAARRLQQLAQAEAAIAAGERDSARKLRDRAVGEANAAQEDARIAQEEAAAAGRDERNAEGRSTAADLSTESLESDLLHSSLDSALLLANAATQVRVRDGAPGALTPARPAPTARGALMTATHLARDGLVHHLQFRSDRPQQLDATAIAPNGRVAAAEKTFAIQDGRAAARLFVWRKGLESGARPVELSTWLPEGAEPLGDITELGWDATGRYLIAVEESQGRLNPLPVRRIRVWDLDAAPPSTRVVSLFGAGPSGLSPLKWARDRSFVTFQTYVCPNDDCSTAIPYAVIFEPRPGAADLSELFVSFPFAETPSLLGLENVSPTGRFVVLSIPDVLDPNISTTHLADRNGSGVHEIPGAAGSVALEFAPDDSAVAYVSGDSTTIDVVDPSTGTLLVPPVPMGDMRVCSFELGRDGVVFAMLDPAGTCQGEVVFVRTKWNEPDLTWIVGPIARPLWGPVSLSPAEGRVTVDWFEDDPTVQNAAHTLVLDAATGAQIGDVTGTVVQYGANERYLVTRQREASRTGPVLERIRLNAHLWDLAQSPAEQVLSQREAVPLPAPDGSVVAILPAELRTTTGPDRPVSIWPLDPFGLAIGAQELPGPRGAIFSGAFDGRGHLVGFGLSSTGLVWRPGLRPSQVVDSVPLDDAMRSATSAADGRTRAITTDGQHITMRRIAPDLGSRRDVQTEIHASMRPTERVHWMSFGRDGRTLLVNLADVSAPVTPTARRRESGSLVVRLGPDGLTPVSVTRFAEEAIATSGDGRRIAFLSLDPTLRPRRSEVVVRNVADLGGRPWTIDTGSLGEDGNRTVENVYTLDWRGERLGGTNTTGRAQIWDRDGPRAPRRFAPVVSRPAATDLSGIAFRRDPGRSGPDAVFALQTNDRQVRLYDLRNPHDRPAATTGVLVKAKARLRFSNDGALLLVDGIYVLDGATLQRLGPRLHHAAWNETGIGDRAADGGTSATFFTADGRFLVAQRTDETEVVRWSIGLDDLRRDACRMAARNLRPEEIADVSELIDDPRHLCGGDV